MLDSATVFVVDDDPQLRESLVFLVTSMGLKVEAFASAEEFLARYQDGPGAPRCLVLDVRMPGLSGLGLQERLTRDGTRLPIIMITGYGNVPMAVQAMQGGAIDFIEKPFARQALMTRIQDALDRDARHRTHLSQRASITQRTGTLSQRERAVLDLIVAGNNAKAIAALLSISEKTVAKHRSRVFQKMQVDSVAALVGLVLGSREPGAGVPPSSPT